MAQVIASTENRNACHFPKGVYFDYAVLFQEGNQFFIEGKGRYGCLTKVQLTPTQAKMWLQLKEME